MTERPEESGPYQTRSKAPFPQLIAKPRREEMSSSASYLRGGATGTAGTAGAAGETAAAAAVGNTSRLVVGGRGRDRAGVGRVDAERQPAQEAVLDGVAQQHVLDDGVARGGPLEEEAVLRVGRELLGVGGVYRVGLDLVDEGLVEVDLADVGGRQVDEGVVGGGGGVEVDQDVNVLQPGVSAMDLSRGEGTGVPAGVKTYGGAAGVVTGDEGVKVGDALRVGGLDPAKPRGVEVGAVRGGVAVAARRDSAVDSGRVGGCALV